MNLYETCEIILIYLLVEAIATTLSTKSKHGTTLRDPQIIVLSLRVLCVHLMIVCKVLRNIGCIFLMLKPIVFNKSKAIP